MLEGLKTVEEEMEDENNFNSQQSLSILNCASLLQYGVTVSS